MPTLEQNTISTDRMLKVIDHLKDSEQIKYRQDFLDIIGVKKQNYRAIVTHKATFTREQITRACKEFNLNANYILGFEKKMFR